MSQTPQSASPAPAAEPEKPRSNWEKIITSTPILLTVVATLLAGLSSSAMTRAQYYRALAAQNQSKVSDQWNFFQAKRIRGTDLEGTAILLRSSTGAGKLSSQSLLETAKALADDCKRAVEDAPKLVSAAKDAGQSADTVRKAAEQYQKDAKAAAAASAAVVAKLEKMVNASPGEDKEENPLPYVADGKVPERAKHGDELVANLAKVHAKVPGSLSYFDPELLKRLYELNPAIPRAVWEVNERVNEKDMTDSLPHITEEQIHTSIVEAEKTASEFEDRMKPVTRAFRDLDKLVVNQTSAVRGLYRSSEKVARLAKDSKLRQTATETALTAGALKSQADELGNDFKAAQLVYDSRRYEQEARDNQTVAGMYELDVRKASVESDRYIERSRNFFYAMLGAQAGVTIATFSIAMRRRGLLWGLATAAGLAAITMAGYVFLKM